MVKRGESPKFDEANPPWSGLRAESQAAHRDGQIFEACNLLRRAVLLDALRWFKDEGVEFVQPDREHTTHELIIGLALAGRGVVEEKGEAASYKLHVAANALEAMAALSQILEAPVPDTVEGVTQTLLSFFFVGVDTGRNEALTVLGDVGVIEAYERFNTQRERRRLGAEIVNGRKASVKEKALGEALRITTSNRTLSNEDLAELVRKNLDIVTTIRTLTDWVRDWRRAGTVPPRSVGAR
jgi:hypothetical protein